MDMGGCPVTCGGAWAKRGHGSVGDEELLAELKSPEGVG